MQVNNIRQYFEQEAFNYNDLILRLIPYYREQHQVMLDMIDVPQNASIKVLDLGCGTGVLSHLVLQNFKQANVVAFDFAENMLAACKNNLSAYQDRVEFKQGDFGVDDIGEHYDLIVSGLAIHHLDAEGKQKLFKKLFSTMNPNGLLLILEIVKGANAQLTQKYEKLWRKFINDNGEDENYWFAKHIEEDIPDSVENQTQWLAQAGFINIGCHWRYLNFAIFGANKPKINQK
ncbi:MAG: class I SAM-dependent methyltransferase [Rivularia sp. (in: Bacteria)]|nr:class I SAM-dependent methyltransferase [Rivularia sp. MS3]